MDTSTGWEKLSTENMQLFSIEDDATVDAIREAGFSCERAYYNDHFPEQFPWFKTNCPIGWNGEYPLSQGRTLISSGSMLEMTQHEPPPEADHKEILFAPADWQKKD